ncbi:MAG: hypothetical protein IH886_12045 [Nitrospinae bacterium]|nr:hypothetical protein [Nitrospinota bacterium]
MMSYHLLIKFSAREHMERLLDEGEVYMNTLAYYREEEKNSERHDPNEGIEKIMAIKEGLVKCKNPDNGKLQKIATVTSGILRFTDSNLDKTAIYCLFHLEIPNNKKFESKECVDERVLEGFGDTAVLIHDVAEFLARVKSAAQKRGLDHRRERVQYVDMSTRNDEVGPFLKDLSFSHQKELRIAVFDEANGPRPIILNIGSIRDIACLISAQEVAEITIVPPNLK